MRLCQIVPSLELRYGGPSRSVLALASELAALGHDVDLLATAPKASAERQSGRLRVHTFQRSAPATVCPSWGLARFLHQHPCDIVHHHALWLRTLHYAQQKATPAGVPLVISPRGMLSAWAVRHHRWRKKFARAFIHPSAFESAAGWHATSEDEAADIRRLGFEQPICVAPNGVEPPSLESIAAATDYWQEVARSFSGRPVALFYSRLHPKKRVIELIDLWLAEAPRDWLLLIVGIPQTYTVDELRSYVFRSAARDRIKIFDGGEAPPPYTLASLFLLPSHSENFGLVVAEAMAHGVPVLVTDTTPWAAINGTEAGRCVSWEDFGATLRSLLAEGSDGLRDRGAIARTWVTEHYSWRRSATALAEFYRSLISTGEP